MTPRAIAPAREAPLPWPLLAAACLGMFAAACSGTTRAPFLIEMARDLETTLPLVANLVAMTSVAWGAASLVCGAWSDRWGRAPFLLGGPIALAVAMLGVAQAGSFLWVAIWATLAGGCSGMFVGALYAEVAGRVQEGQRGRALGWVMAGQSLTLLVGVPLAALIGTVVGWRGVNVVVGALALAAAAGLFASMRGRPSGRPVAGSTMPSWRSALSPAVLRLLAMGVAERICYGLTAVYFATFLQATYGLALAEVALPLVVFALGNIFGTILGGQLADRLARHRLGIFAGAMLASGVAALALFGWTTGVEMSVGLGFVYVFINALARPSLMAAIAGVPDEIRGTVLGLNVTSASFGWLGAASLGGWMMATHGFGGFGWLAAGVSVIGAVLALARR